MRWTAEQIRRADAVAARMGVGRSVVQRIAFDKGIELLEEFVGAVEQMVDTPPAASRS